MLGAEVERDDHRDDEHYIICADDAPEGLHRKHCNDRQGHDGLDFDEIGKIFDDLFHK